MHNTHYEMHSRTIHGLRTYVHRLCTYTYTDCVYKYTDRVLIHTRTVYISTQTVYLYIHRLCTYTYTDCVHIHDAAKLTAHTDTTQRNVRTYTTRSSQGYGNGNEITERVKYKKDCNNYGKFK